MNTKDIINSLVQIHGKKAVVKSKFTELYKKQYTHDCFNNFSAFIQSICVEMGIVFDSNYKMNNNTANAVAAKLCLD
jgi:hypothetical protein